MTTCRDEILDALPQLSLLSPDGTFTTDDVVAELEARQSTYAKSTIETHVRSRMCANAPDNHATVYNDLERVSVGRYRAWVQ